MRTIARNGKAAPGVLACFLTFLLAFALMPILPSSAIGDSGSVTISVGTVTIEQGDTEVTVPVSVANNPGIGGFSFVFGFNTDVLTLKNVEGGGGRSR